MSSSACTWESSYADCLNYPENLISRGTLTYSSRLSSYKQRLGEAERDLDLCLVDSLDNVNEDFELPIIDFGTQDGQRRVSKRLHSPEKVTRWLNGSQASETSPRQNPVLQRDPKCRFIYFYGENSKDKLKVTRASLTQVLTYHQVMPAYLDFMLVFGGQTDPRDLRFSGFREQVRLKTPQAEQVIPSLGRSGKGYQLSFNLKGVTLNRSNSENLKLSDWSIRQAAIHHQFDVENGTSLWIVTKGSLDLLNRYKDLTGPEGQARDRDFSDRASCFRTTLTTHLLLSYWSAEDWRWYIRWLEEVVAQESRLAVDGLREQGRAHKEYKPQNIQEMQHWQDKANEVVMVLEVNTRILQSLRSFYSTLFARKDFPSNLKSSCEDDVEVFIHQLDEILENDFDMQIERAKLLAKVISDRKELILQHLQGQASERTEQLNRNLEREAVVMRIITIVTLFYLPATFVSTFFGTDVVKYQDQNDMGGKPDGSFSATALRRWLQVTLPLTALTLFGAWMTYRHYDRPRRSIPARTKEVTEQHSHVLESVQVPAPKVLNNKFAEIYNHWRQSEYSWSRLPLKWLRERRATLPTHEASQPVNIELQHR